MRTFKILTAILIILTTLTTASQAKTKLIVNEIMIDPQAVSDTDGEWFELYNDGKKDIDINGWIIKDTGNNYHIIDNGGALVVPAKGYLVLGRSADVSVNGGFLPDYVYSGFQLANSEDDVVLEEAEGSIIEINYDNNWPVEKGKSIAYIGTGDLADPANWFTTPEEEKYIYGTGDYGTPGAPNVMP